MVVMAVVCDKGGGGGSSDRSESAFVMCASADWVCTMGFSSCVACAAPCARRVVVLVDAAFLAVSGHPRRHARRGRPSAMRTICGWAGRAGVSIATSLNGDSLIRCVGKAFWLIIMVVPTAAGRCGCVQPTRREVTRHKLDAIVGARREPPCRKHGPRAACRCELRTWQREEARGSVLQKLASCPTRRFC